MLIAPKVAEDIKKTLVTLKPVYTNNIDERDNPINAAKTQKVVCAFPALILFMPKLM